MLHYAIRVRGEGYFLSAHGPGTASFVNQRDRALLFEDRERVEGIAQSLALACDVVVLSDEAMPNGRRR